jgi:hypothetical protein
VTALEPTVALELGGTAFANLVRASWPVALRFQWQVALAGAQQLRTATRRVADAQAARAPHGADARFGSDGWDDWDSGGPSGLELALTPRR